MNASGHGKIILLGEHFVVHGQPAIVSALPQVTTATISTHGTLTTNALIDNRPKILNFKPTKATEYLEMASAICKHLGVKQSLEITLGGNLVVTSGGIGASAASATAITKALNLYFKLNLTDEQIFYTALEGEKAIHGQPSGIDNMAALRGDTFIFKKNLEMSPSIEPIKLKKPLHLVLIDSNIPANTKTAIATFKASLEKYPNVQGTYENLFLQGKDALVSSDINSLAEAMNRNHTLLQKMDISNQFLDSIVTMSLEAGAIGAKLTGSGLGGLVVALVDNDSSQTNIFEKLRNSGLFVQKLVIN